MDKFITHFIYPTNNYYTLPTVFINLKIMINNMLVITWFITLMIISIAINYFFIIVIIEAIKVTWRRVNWLLKVFYIQSKLTKEEIKIMKDILDKYDN